MASLKSGGVERRTALGGEVTEAGFLEGGGVESTGLERVIKGVILGLGYFLIGGGALVLIRGGVGPSGSGMLVFPVEDTWNRLRMGCSALRCSGTGGEADALSPGVAIQTVGETLGEFPSWWSNS